MSTATLTSCAEFERLAEGPDQIELLQGELIRMPPAQFAHMQTCERLYNVLDQVVQSLRTQRRLGNVQSEMGCMLPSQPPSWFRPCVSITHGNQSVEHDSIGAPLTAFEVVSESDFAMHLAEKVAPFLENGSEAWLIYPNTGRAWVFDGSGSSHETRVIQTPLWPEVQIPLSEIL